MPTAPSLSRSAAPAADDALVPTGVLFAGGSTRALQHTHWQLMEQLQALGLASLVDARMLPAPPRGTGPAGPVLQVALRPTLIEHWTPGHDTRELARTLALDSRHADDLAREIVVALLASPQAQVFPSHAEWAAALRVRQHIVQAARATRLNPDPEAPRRPPEDWLRDPAQGPGPLLRAGRPLHLALQALLHPSQGPGYALSPYRASEYVLLLALAEETRRHHPVLYQRLQLRFERRPLRDCEFHQVLLRQIGHPEAPLPCGFVVPGDRLWLRPPRQDTLAYSPLGGRWALYLGQGEYREFDARPGPSRQPPWNSPEHTAAWQPMREFPRLLCPGSSDIVL